jgi:hypothetical protein
MTSQRRAGRRAEVADGFAQERLELCLVKGAVVVVIASSYLRN